MKLRFTPAYAFASSSTPGRARAAHGLGGKGGGALTASPAKKPPPRAGFRGDPVINGHGGENAPKLGPRPSRRRKNPHGPPPPERPNRHSSPRFAIRSFREGR